MSTEMKTPKPSELKVSKQNLENSYKIPSAEKPIGQKQKFETGQNNIVSFERSSVISRQILKAIEFRIKGGQDPMEATIHVLSSFKNKIDTFESKAKIELLERIQQGQRLDISSQEILAKQIDPTIATKNGIPENTLTQEENIESRSQLPIIWDGKIESLQTQITKIKTDEFNTEMAFSGILLTELQLKNQIANVLFDENGKVNSEMFKINGENMESVMSMVKKMVMKNILRQPMQEVYQNYLKIGKNAIDNYLTETIKDNPNAGIYSNLLEKSMKLSGGFDLILNNLTNQLTLRNLFNS